MHRILSRFFIGLCLTVVISAGQTTSASDQRQRPIEMTQGQVAIVGAMLGADGYLTSDMHRVFWEDVSEYAMDAAGGIVGYATQLEADLLRRVDLMHEMWLSAASSWELGEEVLTPGFTAALEAHKALAAESNRLARLGARQDTASMTQLILMAASSGEMVRDGDEPMILRTEIDAGIAARPGAAGRAQTLARREWHPTENTHYYEAAGISVRSAWPFTVRSNAPHAPSRVRLTLQMDRVSAIEVVRLSSASGPLAEEISRFATQRGFTAMTVADAEPFHSFSSATLRATLDKEGGPLAVTARGILLGPEGDMLILLAEAGRGDAALSEARLKTLEKALSFGQ